MSSTPPFSIPASVCVYCGSSNVVADKYKQWAQQVGSGLAQRGSRVIYGGGHVGLMGIVAESAIKAGGKVVGIIPEHLRAQEVQFDGVTKLHVVPDMHTRKRMMVEHADAFIILPGGLGTLDEAFEILTWKKLELHNKPIIIVNQDGYWDEMIALIDKTITEGFSRPADRALFREVKTIEEMFDVLAEPRPADHEVLAERL